MPAVLAFNATVNADRTTHAGVEFGFEVGGSR